MLKGQARKDYQRNYMREYRRKHKHPLSSVLRVRPDVLDPVRPIVRPNPHIEPDFSDWGNLPKRWAEVDADGNPIPEY